LYISLSICLCIPLSLSFFSISFYFSLLHLRARRHQQVGEPRGLFCCLKRSCLSEPLAKGHSLSSELTAGQQKRHSGIFRAVATALLHFF
jgi:hypothetical protein